MLHAMKQKALSAAAADSLRNSPRDSPAVSLSGKAQGGKNSPICHCPGLSSGLPRVRSDCSSLLHHEFFLLETECASLHLLIQASSTIVKDLLGTGRESWKSGMLKEAKRKLKRPSNLKAPLHLALLTVM